MGRPVNKKYFGTPTVGGDQIKCTFNYGAGPKDGFIVKQKANKKFLCQDAEGIQQMCKLLQVATNEAAVSVGEMTINVKLDNTDVVQVVKIANRVMTATDGNRYPWNFSTSTTDGAAQMEEAGDGINDNFTPEDPADDTLDQATDFGDPS
jgi:hypothetical protein